METKKLKIESEEMLETLKNIREFMINNEIDEFEINDKTHDLKVNKFLHGRVYTVIDNKFIDIIASVWKDKAIKKGQNPTSAYSYAGGLWIFGYIKNSWRSGKNRGWKYVLYYFDKKKKKFIEATLNRWMKEIVIEGNHWSGIEQITSKLEKAVTRQTFGKNKLDLNLKRRST